MHFDSLGLGVVGRVMRKGLEVEICTQLTVSARQDVLVEQSSHAFGIIVRGMQDSWILDAIDPDQQPTAAQHACRALHEREGFGSIEIADRRAREKSDPPRAS